MKSRHMSRRRCSPPNATPCWHCGTRHSASVLAPQGPGSADGRLAPMKILPLIAAMAVPLWLAGCVTPPPGPASLAATAAPQWHAPLPHQGTLSDLTQWWQQFNDPLLVQLIESAQTSSPDVASA